MKSENVKTEILSDSTGNLPLAQLRIVRYPFDKYEINVRVTPDGKFVDIWEVKVNQDFLSRDQRLQAIRSNDVGHFYPEDKAEELSTR